MDKVAEAYFSVRVRRGTHSPAFADRSDGGFDEEIPNGAPIADFGGPQSTIGSRLSRFDNTITDLSLSIAYLTILPQI